LSSLKKNARCCRHLPKKGAFNFHAYWTPSARTRRERYENAFSVEDSATNGFVGKRGDGFGSQGNH
jgi:hypothetical protein